ncbi:protein of unknown function (plasmid) [Rhodovastum atsumiense]|nr:protein of unknown function [Rhodovastum atsumiense]
MKRRGVRAGDLMTVKATPEQARPLSARDFNRPLPVRPSPAERERALAEFQDEMGPGGGFGAVRHRRLGVRFNGGVPSRRGQNPVHAAHPTHGG